MPGYSTGFGASPVPLGVGSAKVEPKHANRFRVTFAGGALNQDVTANTTTCDRPKTTFSKLQVDRGESKAYFAGKPTFEPINIELEDAMDNSVATSIEAQLAAQFDTNTLLVAKNGSGYKFTTRIEVTDGSGAVLETYVLYGCWIESYDRGNMNYASDADAVKLSVSLSYDLPVRI